MEAHTPAIAISESWLLHVKEVLKTTPAENLAMVADTVAYLKAQGRALFLMLSMLLMDSRMIRVCVIGFKAAAEAGADWVVLCDTMEAHFQAKFQKLSAKFYRTWAKASWGYILTMTQAAVANALAAVEKGARMVQGQSMDTVREPVTVTCQRHPFSHSK